MEFRGSEAENFENEGKNDEEFQENHTNFKYRACVVGPEGATTELHKDLWYQCLKEPKSDTQGIELKNATCLFLQLPRWRGIILVE